MGVGVEASRKPKFVIRGHGALSNSATNPHDREGGGLIVCPIIPMRRSLGFREI